MSKGGSTFPIIRERRVKIFATKCYHIMNVPTALYARDTYNILFNDAFTQKFNNFLFILSFFLGERFQKNIKI